MEGLDHQRHPAGRHAGERAHANEAVLQSVQLADGKAELLLPLDDGLKDGQQLRPLRADLDARAIAREQRDVPMLLQVRDHAAHGRLRVAQLRGGLCDATGLDGLEVGQIFVDHALISLLASALRP